MKHEGLFSRTELIPAAATPTNANGAVGFYNGTLGVITVEVTQKNGAVRSLFPLTPGYHPYEARSVQSASAVGCFLCFQDQL